jgi:hypothetical protein
MDSQVHIAGPTLRVGNVRRQRCVWCGALLADAFAIPDDSCMALSDAVTV